MAFSMDETLKILGIINGAAFVAIALGDFVMFTIDKIVSKTLSPRDDVWAQKLTMWWGVIKEIYDQYRDVIDRISSYSRPKGQ